MIKRIVLTGGPCGGKTTALPHISRHLQNLGYHVMIVPESATLLIGGAALHIPSLDEDGMLKFESTLVNLQIDLEDSFLEAAKLIKKKVVIIYDRGTVDLFGFMTKEMSEIILQENHLSFVKLRDQRYDAVIHIATAADGAEEFYTLENNASRTETPEQAKEIDKNLKEVWIGHPRLKCITNEKKNFDEKIKDIVSAVCKIVGEPEPKEIERKFLVTKEVSIPVRHECIDIEQIYLTSTDPKMSCRVRKRGQNGTFIYTHTSKTKTLGERVELERMISAREYLNYLKSADPSRKTIKKTRKCFLHKGIQFELDFIHEPKKMTILEIEVDSLEEIVHIPKWIPIEREVTSDINYYNSEISKDK